MSKKTLILIVAVILLLLLSTLFYLFSSKKLSFPGKVNNPSPAANLEKDTAGSTSGCAYCDGLTGESLAKCKTAIDCP